MESQDEEISAEEEPFAAEAHQTLAETPPNTADPSENAAAMQTFNLDEEEAGVQMDAGHPPAEDSKPPPSLGHSPGSDHRSSHQEYTHGQPTSTIQDESPDPFVPEEQSHHSPELGDQSHSIATHEQPPTEHSSTEHPYTELPPTEHPPTEHPPTEHPPTEHPPTEHPPTEHQPTEHPPTEDMPTDHLLEPTLEQPRDASVDQEYVDLEPETQLSVAGENVESEVGAEDVQDMDEEGQEFPPEDRGPPMAPPPAVLGHGDELLESAPLGNEFLEDNMLRHEFNLPPRVKVEEKAAQPKPPKRIKKILPTYPFRAKMRSDAEIETTLRQGPPRHEYCGFLFSSVTPRPTGGYTNYFLPVYPQPQPKQHIQISGIKVPTEKIGSVRDTAKGVLPLSTIKVSWPSRRTSTVYNLENIYAYLSRFGPIDGVYPKSVNSAFVVFSDLEAARAVLTCPHLGRPWDQLIASWAEPRMYNSGFYYKYALAETLPTRYRI